MYDIANIDPSLDPFDVQEQSSGRIDIGRDSGGERPVAVLDPDRTPDGETPFAVPLVQRVRAAGFDAGELAVEAGDQRLRQLPPIDRLVPEAIEARRRVESVLAKWRPTDIAAEADDNSREFGSVEHGIAEHAAELLARRHDEIVRPLQSNSPTNSGRCVDRGNAKRGRNQMCRRGRRPRHIERDEQSAAGFHVPASVSPTAPCGLQIGESHPWLTEVALGLTGQVVVRRTRLGNPHHVEKPSSGEPCYVHRQSVSRMSQPANSLINSSVD